ncbi:MAG: helix-turn-helix domain-containing protein [Candidatus Eremiobacteraeota bacterium]|nr:helix-turn-helix domain-containing protein [Candidatus Eremiobacteraeota bacterium]
MSRGAVFDVARFYAALDEVRVSRGVQWRQVAAESGVAASTLTRIAQGRRPDVDSLAALLSWAALDANLFLGISKNTENTIAAVTALVREDADLSPQKADAMAKIIRMLYDVLKSERKPR